MKEKAARTRLDLLLVERKLAESPEKAAAVILAGEVQVDGQRLDKAGTLVARAAKIEVASRHQKYVSRGGFKLEGALKDFSVDPAGLVCLDIGSSHGGFTDCLLQREATRVYAVDVTIEQLDWKLRQDARVVPVKKNARDLQSGDIPELTDLVVIDVSFISVEKVLEPAAKLAKPRAIFVILIKPQFELPRKQVGAGGIVKGKRLREKAVLAVSKHAKSLGFKFLKVRPSRVAGAEGNQEYFLYARKKSVE
ncbi:MAG: TlyA family rRNA (cytidine-2'-O)-methyltransferase [Acidobacteria bacterium]|nr:MAG: TlyA family rRNA (cytidine-2'-O)-methyltransferase [Acidobacteriota bacterium]